MSHWMTSGKNRLKAKENRSFAHRAQSRAAFLGHKSKNRSRNNGPREVQESHPRFMKRTAVEDLGSSQSCLIARRGIVAVGGSRPTQNRGAGNGNDTSTNTGAQQSQQQQRRIRNSNQRQTGSYRQNQQRREPYSSHPRRSYPHNKSQHASPAQPHRYLQQENHDPRSNQPELYTHGQYENQARVYPQQRGLLADVSSAPDEFPGEFGDNPYPHEFYDGLDATSVYPDSDTFVTHSQTVSDQEHNTMFPDDHTAWYSALSAPPTPQSHTLGRGIIPQGGGSTRNGSTQYEHFDGDPPGNHFFDDREQFNRSHFDEGFDLPHGDNFGHQETGILTMPSRNMAPKVTETSSMAPTMQANALEQQSLERRNPTQDRGILPPRYPSLSLGAVRESSASTRHNQYSSPYPDVADALSRTSNDLSGHVHPHGDHGLFANHDDVPKEIRTTSLPALASPVTHDTNFSSWNDRGDEYDTFNDVNNDQATAIEFYRADQQVNYEDGNPLLRRDVFP